MLIIMLKNHSIYSDIGAYNIFGVYCVGIQSYTVKYNVKNHSIKTQTEREVNKGDCYIILIHLAYIPSHHWLSIFFSSPKLTARDYLQVDILRESFFQYKCYLVVMDYLEFSLILLYL